MCNTGGSVQCTHEEEQAGIESGQGILRCVVVLLAVHCAQEIVASLENTRDALEDGPAEVGRVMCIRSPALASGVCHTGGVPAPASGEQFSRADPVVHAFVQRVHSAAAGVFPDKKLPLAPKVEAYQRHRLAWGAECDALADRSRELVQVLPIRNVEICPDLACRACSHGVGCTAGEGLIRLEGFVGFSPGVC